MAEILVFDPTRRHNGDLIRDAAQLGWLPEPVFDATYGLGRFWSEYKPETLVTNDLNTEADSNWDWTQPIGTWAHGKYGTVVFDGPYKLQGSPSKAMEVMNTGYGVHVTRTVTDLLQMLRDGATNLMPLVAPKGFLLVKCQDQIVCGKFTSQTQMFVELVTADPAWSFESWLHLSSTPRPQRSQVKPRNNYSTLLAFKRRR